MSASFGIVPPPPELRDAVQCVWFARGQTPHRAEVVLPNGVTEVILNLADPQWVLEGPRHPARRYHETFVAGLQRGPLVIADDGATDLIGIRFHPGGLADWIALPLVELTDRIEPGHAVELPWLAQLREHLGNLPDAARADAIFASLRRQRRRSGAPDRVQAALQALGTRSEPPTVRVLAARLGVSHKHLITLFHRAVGVTPRTLRRVLRFHRVVRALQEPAGPSWAALALDCGYSDQAHLIREFRELADCTPTEFLRRRTDDGWHLKVKNVQA